MTVAPTAAVPEMVGVEADSVDSTRVPTLLREIVA